MRLLKDALTAKTVAQDLISKADSIAKRAKSHPGWRYSNDVLPGTLNYTSIGFRNLNWNLRNDKPLNSSDQYIHDDLMADMRTLTSPFTAFRVLNQTANYKEGYKFKAKSFWSTSLDFNSLRMSGQWDIECIKFLIIPKGVQAIMIQGVPAESEIILPPGTQFTVRHKATNFIDKTTDTNIAEIYVIYARN